MVVIKILELSRWTIKTGCAASEILIPLNLLNMLISESSSAHQISGTILPREVLYRCFPIKCHSSVEIVSSVRNSLTFLTQSATVATAQRKDSPHWSGQVLVEIKT